MQTALGMSKMLKISQGYVFLELILVSSFSSTSSDQAFLVLQSVWLCPGDPRGILEPFVGMWTNGGCFTALTFLHTAVPSPKRNFLKHTDIPQHQSEFAQEKVGKKPSVCQSLLREEYKGGRRQFLSVITVFPLGVG